MMPRPAKRGAAASETLQIRITPRERELIDEHRGFHTVTDFILDSVMGRIQQMNAPIREPQPGGWTAPTETLYDLNPHRHKRGTLASETTIKGVTIRSWNCSEPGCTEILGGKG